MNVLVAPAHYMFSDKIKSEPAWSYALVKLIGSQVSSMDVLSGVKDITTPLDPRIKIYSLFSRRSESLLTEFLRHVIFYPFITLQAIDLMLKKKYQIIHHMLPLSYATLNPLVFLVKLFSPKTKVILGPLQLPQTQKEEQDLNVVFLGKQNYSPLSKITYKLTMIITQLVQPLAAKMFETADLVVCNSQTSQNHYSKLFPKAKFKIIYTGMDAMTIPKPSSHSKEKKIKILCAGLFSKRKGQIFLLRAFKDLIKKHSNIELTLIGAGDQDEAYRSFVKDNNLDKFVTFTGQVSYADLLTAYQNHHIFCLPTLSDTSPYVILEAMTFGLPVVASDVGSIKEMLGSSGLVVEPGNVPQLTSQLSKVISSPAIRQGMSKTGQSRVSKNFTWDTISKQWLDTYRDLVKNANF